MCNEHESIEEIEGKYYKGNIYPDRDPLDPREDSHLGIMVTWHKRYTLGDEQPKEEPWEWLPAHKKEVIVILPLFLYDHSGISISTCSFIGRAQHAEWDSGQVGYIYTTRERILELLGKKKITKETIQQATNLLEKEVEEYDQYLRGDIYQYTIEDAEGEIVDSCSGIYGLDYAKTLCTDIVKFYDDKQQQENEEVNLRLLAVCGGLDE